MRAAAITASARRAAQLEAMRVPLDVRGEVRDAGYRLAHASPARWAAVALLMRDRMLDATGTPSQHYRTLIAPWEEVFGQLHPLDTPAPTSL